MKLKHEKCITSCNKLNKFHMQRHKIKFHKYICNTQTVLYLIIKNILKDFLNGKVTFHFWSRVVKFYYIISRGHQYLGLNNNKINRN